MSDTPMWAAQEQERRNLLARAEAAEAHVKELEAEVAAWHDWFDKPHKDDRYAALMALLPEEYQDIPNPWSMARVAALEAAIQSHPSPAGRPWRYEADPQMHQWYERLREGGT